MDYELDDAEFRRLLHDAIGDRSDAEVGDLLRVSRSTIQRWREGKSAPYRTLRSMIIEALQKRAE